MKHDNDDPDEPERYAALREQARRNVPRARDPEARRKLGGA